MGIIISHYKDPYLPTRIQWKVIRVFFVAHMVFHGSCAAMSPPGWSLIRSVWTFNSASFCRWREIMRKSQADLSQQKDMFGNRLPSKYCWWKRLPSKYCWWFRNSALINMVNILWFAGFHACCVFFSGFLNHQKYWFPGFGGLIQGQIKTTLFLEWSEAKKVQKVWVV